MDKETLSHYGWIVVLILILSVMLAFGTPFGKFVAKGVSSALKGYVDTNDKVLSDGHINDLQQEFEDYLNSDNDDFAPGGNNGIGGTGNQDDGGNPNGGGNQGGTGNTVPEGGQYTTSDGTIYNPGDTFPDTVTTGDKYRYGDYVYGYNMYSASRGATWLTWTKDESQNGWGVCVADNTYPAYGEMLATINGKPVTSLKYTFAGCSSLLTSGLPKSIPSTVTNMCGTFQNCFKITTLGSIVIPDGVTIMDQTFYGCYKLIEGVEMPDGVTKAFAVFENCYDMVTYRGNPNGNGDFSDYKLPSSLNELNTCFRGCKSMVIAPQNIGYNVKSMDATFHSCTSLKTAPVIPPNVHSTQMTFYGCTSLTGTITIQAYPSTYTACFGDVDFKAQNLYLEPASSTTNGKIDSMGATGKNYCTDCNGACQENLEHYK